MANTSKNISELISNCDEIPVIPAAALQLLSSVDDPNVGSLDIAKIISTDQSLTAKVLKLANSSYYGMQGKVTRLTEAVMILGTKNVRNLAILASADDLLNISLRGYRLGSRQLWTHSFSVGVGCRLIAEVANLKDVDIAFTSGLLHDIGKLVMSVTLDKELKKVFDMIRKDSIPFNIAEKEVLGFDHTEIGEALAQKWNLPQVICDVVRYHHNPNDCKPSNVFVDCAHVANYLTMTMGFGLGIDGLYYEFFPESLDRLNISNSDIDRVIDDFVYEYENYERLFEEYMAA